MTDNREQDPEPVSADRRRAAAIHEAGHAVAHVVLDLPVEFATLRPSQSALAAVMPASRPVADLESLDIGRPVACQPAALRADIERRVIAFLAGSVAEYLLADDPAAARYTSDESNAIAKAALDTLPPRLVELVNEHEQREPSGRNDETNARGIADAFAGPVAGIHYLEFLRGETEELVRRYRSAIVRVADALERSAVLEGAAVVALVFPSRAATPDSDKEI